jgi:predicted RNA-binding Zn-ribbon protein involved in translation (DUF1610 family)
MGSDGSRSPLERLKRHYDQEELVCPECGFEDEEGAWEAEADGAQVLYRHTCPKCGAEREHELAVSDADAARDHVRTRRAITSGPGSDPVEPGVTPSNRE